MKTKAIITTIALLVAALWTTSCEKENPKEETPAAPVISFGNETLIYTVKVGKTITIEPIVENDEDAMYSWTVTDGEGKGKIIGTEKILTYRAGKESGQVFVAFKVLTGYGAAEEEIRIDVAELVPPRITLGVPKDGYTIGTDYPLNFAPVVDNSDAATYTWTVNAEVKSTAQTYTFSSPATGTFRLALKTANEDGKDSIAFHIYVKTPAEMPFSWAFADTAFSVAQGRVIGLTPLSITNALAATYTWTDNGHVQTGAEPLYIFNSAGRAQHTTYTVSVTMKNPYYETSQTLTVAVCAPEGTYKRTATAASSPDWDKVYEFLPAPGQFVNEYYTATTMAEAVGYAEGRLRQEAYVSLGGFGGYVVLGFDHSIDNDDGYNFMVLGNSFEGSSEPGVVWVMQDENGDRLPNDTWYELRGSEYGKPETIQDYEVTYYRPSAPQMPVAWTDNYGKAGTIDYLIAYHQQDYYYPLWVTTDTYTLRGTRLKDHTRQLSVTPQYWVNESFDGGYADNFSKGAGNDRLTNDINYDASVNANHFKISNAVRFDGQPADLQYIDFIKVQTGVNAKAGWLGENSTEVFGAKDYNLIK
ncbi:MAG: cell surface protein [Prevotellaceae bacterium]|jgi:hypothetical protein|nr:cell surface protein [Prevotellaceae bacterium]